MLSKDRPTFYTLDENKNPIPCDDPVTWSIWFESHNHERRIADDYDEADPTKAIRVSTVFLGIDHNYSDRGPALLYETMVFGGPLDEEQDRYATRDEALAGHQAMCRRVMAATE